MLATEKIEGVVRLADTGAIAIALALSCCGEGRGAPDAAATDAGPSCEQLERAWREAVSASKSCDSTSQCVLLDDTEHCDARVMSGGVGVNSEAYARTDGPSLSREWYERGCPGAAYDGYNAGPSECGIDGRCTDGHSVSCFGPTCNPLYQTGCATGHKCAYIIDLPDPPVGHVGCAPDGTDAIGDACSEAAVQGTADSCRAGGHCYNGTCRAICTTFEDTCSDGTCVGFADGEGNPHPLEWCLQSCDPLLQDCSTDNESCYVVRGEGVCMETSETSSVGEPCSWVNDCETGSQCVPPAGVCRKLCGTIDQIWGVDAEGMPTWPTCCGADCEALAPCPGANELCWPALDGAGDPANVGLCIPDTEASNPDGDPPWTCDCTLAGAEKCAFDTP